MKFTGVCALICIGICGSFTSAKVLPIPKDDHHWSYLILAQFWPESSCIYFQEKGEDCDIPPNVRGWTIHGLWPSRPDSTEFPHNCNDSMVFDMSEIEVLRPKLDLEWHYYNKDGEPTYLWNHEWTKHGTCAYSLPALRGELKFFSKTLDLHGHLNITDALAKFSVIPSESQTYKREDFFNAVMKYYQVKPFVVCDYDRDTRKTYIDQIYICYNKNFDRQDCYPSPSKANHGQGPETYPDSYYEKCEEQDNIYYIPFNNKNRRTNKKNQDRSLRFQSEISKH